MSIRQMVVFEATPTEVYELIMDSEKHAEFTGSAVAMSREVDGKFKVFDGYCHGYNIEIDPGKKIVQAWHFAEDGWPDDHFSICTFLFEPFGNETRMTFLQTEVPEHKIDALKDGWNEYYWEPMKEYLEARN